MDKLAKYWAAEEIADTLLDNAYYDNNDITVGELDKIKTYLAQFLKKEWFR